MGGVPKMTITAERPSRALFDTPIEGFDRRTAAEPEPAPATPWRPTPEGAGGLSPRTLQLTALTALTTALAVHDRTQLVMACGTGKTLVGRWHAQAADAQQTVV